MAARTTVTLTKAAPARLADSLGLAAGDRQVGDVLSLRHSDALALVTAGVARFGSAAQDAAAAPTVADRGAFETVGRDVFLDRTTGLMAHKLSDQTTPTEPGAFVSFGADDGYGTFAPFFAMLASKGVKGTLFLTKNFVGASGTSATWSNDTFITKAQVEAIRDQGHELATHGVNHEDHPGYRTTNGTAAFAALVKQGVDYIEQTYGVKVRTGAYPAGLSDARTREVMGRFHEFYRGTKGTVARGGQDPYDVTAVDIQALTEAQIKALVDTAVAERAMLPFLVHGGLTEAVITKLANVVDYCTSLGVQMGTFYEGMRQRTSWRGSTGAHVDASGHAFLRSLRTTRMEVVRDDKTAGSWFADIDEATDAPYFDSVGGTPFEFRKRLTLLEGLNIGRRRIFGDVVTTSGQTTITSGSAGFSAARDNGITITGAGIPAGATIQVINATSATLSAPATATATNVVATLGRPLASSADFVGDVNLYGAAKIIGTGPALQFEVLGTGPQGNVSGSRWANTSGGGAGGTMTVDTGTGGSNFDIKAIRARLLDHTGARKRAFATSAPTDASIANGELVDWLDTSASPPVVRFKAKDAGGTVYAGSVALA